MLTEELMRADRQRGPKGVCSLQSWMLCRILSPSQGHLQTPGSALPALRSQLVVSVASASVFLVLFLIHNPQILLRN